MLDTDDLHHLARVLRLRAGSKVTCSDGVGGWRSCEFTGATLSPVEAPDRSIPPPVSHLFVAVPKGDRVDWLVQKATEVGVGRLTFVDFERSVVRWSGDRADKQLQRLRRIAREASSQSRRVWLPVVDGPIRSVDLPAHAVFADPAGDTFGVAHLGRPVVIGPEGGFAPHEVDGVTLCSFGEQVLRVETAAVVAGVLLARA